MCTVSAVTDHYYKSWPSTTADWTKVTISYEEWAEYQRLKQNALEIDKITKQPDCIKPELKQWEETIERILKEKGLIK